MASIAPAPVLGPVACGDRAREPTRATHSGDDSAWSSSVAASTSGCPMCRNGSRGYSWLVALSKVTTFARSEAFPRSTTASGRTQITSPEAARR